MLTLLTGPRWAIGAARPGAARPPGRQLAWRVRRERPRASRTVDEELAARGRGRRPDRGGVARATRSTTRATPTTRPRRASGSPCSPRSCAALRRHAGEPLLDLVRRIIDTTGIDVELAVVGQPGRARPARQPRPVRQGGRGVPGDRRRRDPAGPAGLPGGRGRVRQRPRRRDPDRGRLGQAADRPPGQGPGVGRGLPGRGLRRTKFPTTRIADQVDHRARRAADPAARRPARPARSWPGTTPPTSMRSPRRLATTRATEELRLGYVAVTRAKHVLVVSSYCWAPQPQDAAWALRRTRSRSGRRSLERGGEARPMWLDKPAKGEANPLAGAGRRRAVAGPRHIRRDRAPAGRGRAGARALGSPDGVTTAASTRRSTVEAAAVGRVGRRARAAARRRRGAARARRGRGAAARRACPRPRWRGCATTRTGSPASWPGRCRASRRRRPGSAPGSTPGWRPGSASSSSLDPDDLPGRADAEHRRRDRPGGADRGVRGRAVRRSGPSHDRAAVRAGARRAGRARPDRRGLRDRRRRLPGRGLEDQPGSRPPTRCSWRSTGVAWAELHGRAASERVRAAFYYVRSGELVEYDDLPDRAGARGDCSAALRLTSSQLSGTPSIVSRASSTMWPKVCSRSCDGRLLAGHDVVADGADRQRSPPVAAPRACRARWPPSRPRARRSSTIRSHQLRAGRCRSESAEKIGPTCAREVLRARPRRRPRAAARSRPTGA